MSKNADLGTLRGVAYQAIRRQLVSGELKPGAQLSEIGLSRQLGISRSPVREAISRLTSEGLLEQLPGTSAMVRRRTRQEVRDLYELREWIEGEAVAQAAQHASAEVLAELKEACAKMRAIADAQRQTGARFASPELVKRLMEADFSFHTALLRGSGNRLALKAMNEYRLLLWVWGRVPEQHDLRHLAVLYRQHQKVYRAVRDGKGDLAREQLRAFVREGLNGTLAAFDRQQRDEASKEEATMMVADWRSDIQDKQIKGRIPRKRARSKQLEAP
jgi:DNA-binding GntR family transcriptional regulator